MNKYKVHIEDAYTHNSYEVACDDISIEQSPFVTFLNGDLALRTHLELGAIETLGFPLIKNVKFNGPATIVFWNDGTKTVVKCSGEVFDPEKGLAMAICKKFLGTNESGSNYYKVFEKWCYAEEDGADLEKFTAFVKPLFAVRKEEK